MIHLCNYYGDITEAKENNLFRYVKNIYCSLNKRDI